VGKKNYFLFMVMLTLLNALLMLQLVVTLSLLIRAGTHDSNVHREVAASQFNSVAAYIALVSVISLVPLIFFALVFSLWLFHVYIIARRMTTYEWILEGRQRRDARMQRQLEAERVSLLHGTLCALH